MALERDEIAVLLLRPLGSMIGIATCIAYFMYMSYEQCGIQIGSNIMAILAALCFVLSFAAAIARQCTSGQFSDDDKGGCLKIFSSALCVEGFAIMAGTLLYASFGFGYSARYNNCTTPDTANRPDYWRDIVLWTPPVQTMCVVFYAAFTHNRRQAWTLGASVMSTLFAIAAMAMHYLHAHSGKVQACIRQSTVEDRPLFDVYRGVVWALLLGSLFMTIAYGIRIYLYNKTTSPSTFNNVTENAATFLMGLGGATSAIITYFVISLVVDDDDDKCPFIFEPHDRHYGNMSIWFVLTALGLQHVMPVMAHDLNKDAADDLSVSASSTDYESLLADLAGSTSGRMNM